MKMRFLAIVLLATAAAPSYGQSAEWKQLRVFTPQGGGECPATLERSAAVAPEYLRPAWAGEEGRAVVGVCAGPDGRASSFEILSSSGAPRLDTSTALAACKRLYQPPINAAGESVASCAHVFDFTWRFRDFHGDGGFIVCMAECDRYPNEEASPPDEHMEKIRAELELSASPPLLDFTPVLDLKPGGRRR